MDYIQHVLVYDDGMNFCTVLHCYLNVLCLLVVSKQHCVAVTTTPINDLTLVSELTLKFLGFCSSLYSLGRVCGGPIIIYNGYRLVINIIGLPKIYMYDVINQSDQASHGSHDKLRPTPKLGGGGVTIHCVYPLIAI